MALQLLKFEGKEPLLLNINKGALDTLISNELCSVTEIEPKHIQTILDSGYVLLTINDTLCTYKIQNGSKKGLFVKIDDVAISLTVFCDIYNLFKTGLYGGSVTPRQEERQVITFKQDFGEYKKGSQIINSCGNDSIIETNYCNLYIVECVGKGLLSSERKQVTVATVKLNPDTYYRSEYDLVKDEHNNIINIGCKAIDYDSFMVLGELILDKIKNPNDNMTLGLSNKIIK
jgi:hypothetical protein